MAVCGTKTNACGTSSYTTGKLHNSSGRTISLGSYCTWKGSQNVFFPHKITDQDVGEFKHSGNNEGNPGSVVGLGYDVADGIKWVVAWSNHGWEGHKVYTVILEGPIPWMQIICNLEELGEAVYSNTNYGYTSELEIDRTSYTPAMTAKIQPSNVKEYGQKPTSWSKR